MYPVDKCSEACSCPEHFVDASPVGRVHVTVRGNT